MLQGIGIQIPNGQQITSRSIEKININLKFPVALKLVSNLVIHKTEHKAICINIKSKSQLIRKIMEMNSNLKKTLQDKFNDTFLIEEMASSPIVEMLIGIEPDQQFGYSLLLGSGGTQAEIINDTTTILMPTTKVEILTAIKKLKLFKLINGFRRAKKVNLENLVSDILNIVSFFEKNKNLYSSLEINPLFVYEDTTCAVDAVIRSVQN